MARRTYTLEFSGDAREVYFVDSDTPITNEEEALAAIEGMRADVTEVSGATLTRIESEEAA
jgi:hypothetical protein